MSYADYTNSLGGPRDGGMMTNREERERDEVDAIVARLTARYGDDALKRYLRLEADDIVREFSSEARDEADDRLWQRMSEGERQLADVHQGPDSWLANADVMEAKYARRHAQQTRIVIPQWISECAA